MSLADRAMKLYEETRAARQLEEQKAEDERRAREQAIENAKYTRAQITLAESPLDEWFPGASWDIMSFSNVGCAAGYSDGTGIVVSDEERSMYLLLERADRDDAATSVAVYCVVQDTDSDTGYSYWSGPQVRSVLDIGQVLTARVKAEADRARR